MRIQRCLGHACAAAALAVCLPCFAADASTHAWPEQPTASADALAPEADLAQAINAAEAEEARCAQTIGADDNRDAVTQIAIIRLVERHPGATIEVAVTGASYHEGLWRVPYSLRIGDAVDNGVVCVEQPIWCANGQVPLETIIKVEGL